MHERDTCASKGYFNRNTMKKSSTELIIIIILWLSVLISLFFNSILKLHFIFGIIALLIVTITFKKFRDLSFGLLFFFLLLSVFNVILFSNVYQITFKFFNLKINITSLLLFVILFYKKIGNVLRLRQEWFAEDDIEIATREANRIKMFKTQFKNLSEDELERKLNSKQIVEDAKKAIHEILNERR